jgi:two-component system, OmpR family, phosphate regulon sensor histidine kinase PhoR
MRGTTIRIVFILSAIVAVIMLATQYLWIKKAYDLAEKDFDRKVSFALRNVGEYLLISTNQQFSLNTDFVKKIKEDYYIVKVADKVDYNSLKELLKRELLAQNLNTVVEYGFYDCESDSMKYGEVVDMSGQVDANIAKAKNFPKLKEENYNYYFGVNFPKREDFLSGQLWYLKLSTVILVLLLCLLAYIIYILFRQRRLQEIQKDFVNNMTHEFKTPLSTIQIASEVLKSPAITNNPTRLLNYATIISNETNHLTTQVERVLQMASADKGSIMLKKSEFSLTELVEETISKYKLAIRHKDGEIYCKMPENEIILLADRLHIRNVLSNLLDNAIKYCEVAPIINFAVNDLGKNVEIIVKDNGIGIPVEHLKNIFDKFFRVPTGNIHNVKGFGLGLSYVKLIAKKHGGDIFCKSEFGKGSEFTIFIPKT